MDLIAEITLSIKNDKGFLRSLINDNDIIDDDSKSEDDIYLYYVIKITWKYWKDIFNNNSHFQHVIQEIESKFPILCDGKNEDVTFEEHEATVKPKNELDIHNIVAKHVSNWKVLGRILGFQENQLDQIDQDEPEIYKKNMQIISSYCELIQEESGWSFWKNILSQFHNGVQAIQDIETEYYLLLSKECTTNMDHVVKDSGNAYICHQYTTKHNRKILPIDTEKKICVSMGSGNFTFKEYQDYKEWIKSKENYRNLYTVFKDWNYFDFSADSSHQLCPILDSIQRYINSTNDKGFVVKGYSLRDHYSLFGKEVFPIDHSVDQVLAYFSNYNLMLYINVHSETRSLAETLKAGAQNIQFAETAHECLRKSGVINMSVIVYNELQSNAKCKQCLDNFLLVQKNVFTTIDRFKKWFERLTRSERICQLQRELNADRNTDVNTLEISEQMKTETIAFTALQTVELPTFTSVKQDQMIELKKMVCLSAKQLKVLISKNKHIIIKGGYGSGKSLVLEKKIERIINNSTENDMFYFICHDHQSEFLNHMKKVRDRFPNKNILVCNSKHLIGRSLKLSSILQHIIDNWGSGENIHIFIDEFNNSFLDEKEIRQILKLLKQFQNSFIVISAQSMERFEISNKQQAPRSQFEIFEQDLQFKLYTLEYSLRCSVEISDFVNATANVLESSTIETKIELNKKVFSNYTGQEIFDNEYGMEVFKCVNEIDVHAATAISRYKFFQSENYGHNVQCGNVNLYYIEEGFGETTFSTSKIYVMKILLDHILDGLFNESQYAENDKFVICTYNQNLFNEVYGAFDNDPLMYNWTDQINEFNNAESRFRILLTNYASIRGFEYENLIFILPMKLRILKYRLIECFTRATSRLHVVIDNEYASHDAELANNLLTSWRQLDYVSISKMFYDKKSERYGLKSIDGNGNETFLQEKMVARKTFFHHDAEGYRAFPWKDVDATTLQDYNHYDSMTFNLNVIICNDNVNILKRFINKKNKKWYFDVKTFTFSYHGQSLLHHAAYFNSLKICELLLKEYEFYIDKVDEFEQTALHLACAYGSFEVAKCLVQNGADIQRRNKKGSLPIDLSTSASFHEILK